MIVFLAIITASGVSLSSFAEASATSLADCKAKAGFVDAHAAGVGGSAPVDVLAMSSNYTGACLGQRQSDTYFELRVEIKGNPAPNPVNLKNIIEQQDRSLDSVINAQDEIRFTYNTTQHLYVSDANKLPVRTNNTTNTYDVGIKLANFTPSSCSNHKNFLVWVKGTNNTQQDANNVKDAESNHINICDAIRANHLSSQLTIDFTGTATNNTSNTGGETTCGGAGALGWMLCPITSIMMGAIGFLENSLILPYLVVNPLPVGEAAAKDPTFLLWRSFADIGNLVLIIAFIILLASQATSLGVSNYGIKRMMPKLLIAAATVNLSYYFFAFVIGGFNVAGAGVEQLVTSIVQIGGGGTEQANPVAWGFGATAGILILILGHGAIIPWVIGLIGSALLILLIAAGCLMLRQMIIVLIVVAYPLLAAIGTVDDSWEKKGRKLLWGMLLMYPVVILLLAAGRIGGILLSSGAFRDPDGNLLTGTINDIVKASATQILFPILPFIALPRLFKAAGLGQLQQGVANAAGRIPAGLRGLASLGPARVPRFIPGSQRANNWLQNGQGRGANALRGLGNFARGAAYVTSGAALENFRTQRAAQSAQRLQEMNTAALNHPIGSRLSGNQEYVRSTAFKAAKEQLSHNREIGRNNLARWRQENGNLSDSDIRGRLNSLFDPRASVADRENGEELRDFLRQNPNARLSLLNDLAAGGRVPELQTLLSNAPELIGDDTTGNQTLSADEIHTAIADNAGAVAAAGGYHLTTGAGATEAYAGPGTQAGVRGTFNLGMLKSVSNMSARDIAGQREAYMNALNTAMAAIPSADLDARTSATDPTSLGDTLHAKLFSITDNAQVMARSPAAEAIRKAEENLRLGRVPGGRTYTHRF